MAPKPITTQKFELTKNEILQGEIFSEGLTTVRRIAALFMGCGLVGLYAGSINQPQLIGLAVAVLLIGLVVFLAIANSAPQSRAKAAHSPIKRSITFTPDTITIESKGQSVTINRTQLTQARAIPSCVWFRIGRKQHFIVPARAFPSPDDFLTVTQWYNAPIRTLKPRA